VSRLQQATKIALGYKCVPGIAIISAMMIPPSNLREAVVAGIQSVGFMEKDNSQLRMPVPFAAI
jgi:hypothetical protein